MALVEQNVDVYRGEQVMLNFTMSPVVDISGWALAFSLAKKRNSATKIIAAQAMTIVSGIAGTYRTPLTEEQSDLAPAIYEWDVWRTDEGFEQLVAIGTMPILAAVRTPATP
jgi:hypothetical protein